MSLPYPPGWQQNVPKLDESKFSGTWRSFRVDYLAAYKPSESYDKFEITLASDHTGQVRMRTLIPMTVKMFWEQVRDFNSWKIEARKAGVPGFQYLHHITFEGDELIVEDLNTFRYHCRRV